MSGWRGQCLCGAVAFTLGSRARLVHECHCGQCRRWSGHVWACIVAQWASVEFAREDGLIWYQHTPRARRGFCGECGSTLFWQRIGEKSVDVSAGALDAPTGLRLGQPSMPECKGDYYAEGWLR